MIKHNTGLRNNNDYKSQSLCTLVGTSVNNLINQHAI